MSGFLVGKSAVVDTNTNGIRNRNTNTNTNTDKYQNRPIPKPQLRIGIVTSLGTHSSMFWALLSTHLLGIYKQGTVQIPIMYFKVP